MKVYLTSGKTVHGGWRVSDRKLREWAVEEGVVFVHPQALLDGTVSPDDFPMTVEVVPTDYPPLDAVILNPAPRGWVYLEALETRTQGLGGQHTTLRLRLFREGEEVGTLFYDSLQLPQQVSVLNPSGELVGTIQGTPEELRQILEAIKTFWGGAF